MATKARFVVAIDFGTAYSGFAFHSVAAKEDTKVHKQWKGEENSYKTSTSVLLDRNGKLLAFGGYARQVFSNFTPEQAEECYFFERFKMLLMKSWREKGETLSTDTELEAHGGKKTMRAMTVIAIALKFMKDEFEEKVEKSLGLKLKSEEIQWEITVPAIWDDFAKGFMRQAAYEAGLGSPTHSERVKIALEPEAAGIFCKGLTVEGLNTRGDMADMKGFRKMEKGEKYIIIDAGGGTVDIAVHEMIDEDKVKELYPPSGGSWGGETVNDAFENMLGEVVGRECLEKVKEDDLPSYLDFLMKFERCKVNWDGTESANINLSLTEGGIFEAYKELVAAKGEKIKPSDALTAVCQKYSERNGLDVNYKKGRLQFGPKAVTRMFAPAIDPMMEHIKKLLTEVEGVGRAFLVGGFSESKYLQDRVKEVVRSLRGCNAKVLIPTSPGEAVLKGAVAYAENPMVVHSRKARLTYGFEVVSDFNPDVHTESSVGEDGSVHGCFNRVIKKGEDVIFGEEPRSKEFEYHKREDWGPGSQAEVKLYSTERDNAVYVEGLDFLASVKFDVPGAGEEGCRVSLGFSMTEIEVSAWDVKSGKKGNASIDYLGRKK